MTKSATRRLIATASAGQLSVLVAATTCHLTPERTDCRPALDMTPRRTAAVLLCGLLAATAASAQICDVCGIRNDHTAKSYSTPFQQPLAEYPACKQYQDASCCGPEIVKKCAS